MRTILSANSGTRAFAMGCVAAELKGGDDTGKYPPCCLEPDMSRPTLNTIAPKMRASIFAFFMKQVRGRKILGLHGDQGVPRTPGAKRA